MDRTPDPACTAHWVAGIRGRALDELGQPLAGGILQMCLRTEDHTQLCLAPTDVEPDGWYRVVLDRELRCIQQVTLRLSARDGAASTTYCRAPMAPVYGVLDIDEDLVVHSLEVPVERPGVGDATAMRTLRFPDGLEVDAVPGDFEFPEAYDQLAAGRVDPANADCFLDEAPSLLGLYAFGPESGIAPGAGFRIPEGTGLADGSRVELWIVGGTYTHLADGEWIEEGTFVPYGHGTVSGGAIAPDPGSELPYLTWLGYRRAD